MPAKASTILDQFEAGLLSRAELEAALINQVYAGLHEFCQIPSGYQHCELETRALDVEALAERELRALLRQPSAAIINPQPAHVRTIELFRMLLAGDPIVCEGGDPLSPTIGAYLYGPPGTGKTHLMAAYGLRVKAALDERLSQVHATLGDVVGSAFDRYTERQISEREIQEESGYVELGNDGLHLIEKLSPSEEFWQAIDSYQTRLRGFRYQPTDLIYVGFKELFEVCKQVEGRQEAMRALESARIVFIDDVHPQSDPQQIQIVLHLLERRYELGRAGTFLTTNLNATELGGGDEMLGRRLLSRCAETLLTIDFTDCEDWRRNVKSRRIRIVEQELERREQTHHHGPYDTP